MSRKIHKIDYKVRSIQLLNYINDINAGRLVTDPFFQRNLVWRDLHKKDFIETILLGYPFPQIFLSKGKIDLEKRISVAAVVDGQQRTNAIMEYINDDFAVNNKYFSDLSDDEREGFFKYEIAVIELDLENDDNRVQEIFQRINRTSNSLTGIEKKASEYSASEYMQFCELITGQISLFDEDEDEDEDEESTSIKTNPYITNEFKQWTKDKKHGKYMELINHPNIFSKSQIAKKSNLMYTVNLVTTYLSGIYNRNDKAWEHAELFKEEFSQKNTVLETFEKTAELYLSFKFSKKSMWYRKANFFSLFIVLANNINREVDIELLKSLLQNFEPSAEYKLAAKEGVNNAKERELRSNYIEEAIRSAYASN